MNGPTDAARAEGRRRAAHPCFSERSGAFARIHLPVAPRCNVRCGFCSRRYDCASEGRPGVTTKVVTPAEAAELFRRARSALPNLSVAGIAGPGDALADFRRTRETFRLVREIDGAVAFCLSTNGLLLPRRARELKELTVSHLTVTVNAVDPEIGARVCGRAVLDGERLAGPAAARAILEAQLEGIRLSLELGFEIKVNCVCLKGVNDLHVEDVAAEMGRMGVSVFNVVRHIPVKGTPLGGLEAPGEGEIRALRDRCARHLPQMRHCRRCRADACGTLSSPEGAGAAAPLRERARACGGPAAGRAAGPPGPLDRPCGPP
ncbi:MAG: radical SAM protein [Deltaproteobacteria bacterium]|jgi:nitrogenase cofactor biosynthesis protein NifB|nr:radical SAM protein [Deltaproteobacteria bacterium]